MWHTVKRNESWLIEIKCEGSRQPLETVSRKTLHFHADLLSEILSFVQSAYFFTLVLIFLSIVFFYLSRGRGSRRRETLARPPWRVVCRGKSWEERQECSFQGDTASRWKSTIMTTIMRGEMKFTVSTTAATTIRYASYRI